MKKFQALAVLCCGLIALPAHAEKKPQVTGLELQQIQSRDIETTVDVAFPAVMTILQDAGYRIQSADKATGLITGMGSNKSKMTYNIWFGIGKKKQVPIVSAFIEQRGKSYTRIRLSFVMSTGKSRNTFTDEEPISDPAPYRDAFERIEKEIFTRTALDAPAPASPQAAAIAATPVAPVSPTTTAQ